MSVFHLKDINTVWLAMGADIAGLDWEEFVRLLNDVSLTKWKSLTTEDRDHIRWSWEDNSLNLMSLIQVIEAKLKHKNNHAGLTEEERDQIWRRWSKQNWMISDLVANVEFKMREKVKI